MGTTLNIDPPIIDFVFSVTSNFKDETVEHI